MTYDIHTDSFEGPLDLLLHLIKRNDLEISEIKIAEITSQYLAYIDLMKELNIDIAGEFLVMASILMQIKAKTLLPSDSEKENEEDPFDHLKNRLLEYQKYKEVGKLLSYKILETSQIYYRPAPSVNKHDYVLDASVFDLISSFRDALTALPESVKEIMYKEIPIEMKIREILDVLEGRQYVSFTEILKIQRTRMDLIVCFMAVLELVKNKQIVAKQSELFQDIRIYRVYNEVEPEVKEDNGVFEFAKEKDDKNAKLLTTDLELSGEPDVSIKENQEENNGNIRS
ncbi:MAG: segregation/condensation protein A [Endomicrobium sp.]|jgi:segregation and condensation protein A|nr:segregation/condensation protein A [Endomicrobium sp.]